MCRRLSLLLGAVVPLAVVACGGSGSQIPNELCVHPNFGINPANAQCEERPTCPNDWQFCVPDAGTPDGGR